jgi:Transposase IS200 like
MHGVWPVWSQSGSRITLPSVGMDGNLSLPAIPIRRVYLDLLRQSIALHGVELISYCLMSNHVHLVAVSHKADGLGQALKNAHGRYVFLL